MEIINMKKCIVVGAGTYGQVYARYLSEEYNIIGFIDDNPDLTNLVIDNLTVLGGRDYLYKLLEQQPEIAVFVPIGDNQVRVSLLEEVRLKGYKTPSFIHKQAIVHESVTVGDAVYILPFSVVMPFTTIDDYVMVSVGTNIAHHANIHKGCFFSHGSNIGAFTNIEENAYISAGVTIIIKTQIGKDSFIGAGAVVIRNVPDKAVIVGNPGKVLKYKD